MNQTYKSLRKQGIKDVDRAIILYALRESDYVVARAAERLSVEAPYFYTIAKRAGVDVDSVRKKWERAKTKRAK